MEIIISDKSSAYGLFIRNLFNKKKMIYIKAHQVEKFKKNQTATLLIFVVTEVSQLNFLKKILENHFEKAIICYDISAMPPLSISKPHVFVSLNKLRTKWMYDLLLAIIKLKGKEAKNLINKNNNAVLNFMDTSIEKQ